MFRKLFRSNNNNKPDRILDHPSKLRVSDAIILGFDEHEDLSNAEFFVEKVTGLDLSEKKGYERRIFHLGETRGNYPLLMWVDNGQTGERLAFSYSANQQHVEKMINISQFTQLFNHGRDYLVEVDGIKNSINQNNWIADKYIEELSHEVYWLDDDPNDTQGNSNELGSEQSCDYFCLMSKDRTAAIEAFVFDGGKTDVYFVKFLPIYKIETLMPAS